MTDKKLDVHHNTTHASVVALFREYTKPTKNRWNGWVDDARVLKRLSFPLQQLLEQLRINEGKISKFDYYKLAAHAHASHQIISEYEARKKNRQLRHTDCIDEVDLQTFTYIWLPIRTCLNEIPLLLKDLTEIVLQYLIYNDSILSDDMYWKYKNYGEKK